ncbi:4-(cytidine 5'-diphospho)-2-C-methyl-D-erythritol kinase [Caloranaerobacter azorensis]|uniref:4-diphosphocytidyl-2-C-methyl-D-erythritol kinase n=1 Tax=Caloranaerobacter azorensis TaxID=116090 RepID=A0A6P1YG45_9FIRM|nr:4-(cytidine 5'-diphospho)-2-C-methyl-D-erythritol kinase [Caloranaerobacter azorensis]QIB27743.1 4-(cytidine 5'-diphospho)-2-C-methyl-D-erythritol kinase [Caloranaerobacter azorensis]
MKKVEVEAHAKINLSLDVIGKRVDGYHEVRMIMQQISLKDIIQIEEYGKDTIIETKEKKIPTDSTNLAYRAWDILSKRFNIGRGVKIKIEKNIPIAAGLAGGSADAAAVLKGLNELWNLNLKEDELMDIGLEIGADVPYCIMGGTALAEGIGEKLTRLKSFKDKLILIAKPSIQVSTAYVYKNLKLEDIKEHPDIDNLIKNIELDNVNFVAKNMINVLETVTINKYPIIQKIKEHMMRFNALGSLMSGSGPTVFGIFDNTDDIIKCKEELETWIDRVHIVKTI